MKNSPLVSIIMPAYNAERYIKESIGSTLNQSYENLELIIINDGSIDETENIIKSFTDKRIIYIKQKNMGVSEARNRGLTIAQGKYITFLDADDVLPKKSIEVRTNYLEENANIDLVDGTIIVKDGKMENIIRRYQPYYNGELLSKLLKIDEKVFFNVCYFFKKSILNDIFFKTKMTHGEDLLFYIDLSSKNIVNYSYVNEIVYLYRSGHVSAMSNMDGLENGYLTLLDSVKNIKNISFFQKSYFRYKVSRILFLSWLFDAKKPCKAFRSLLYTLLNIKKKYAL